MAHHFQSKRSAHLYERKQDSFHFLYFRNPILTCSTHKGSTYLVRPHSQLVVLTQSEDDGVVLHAVHSKAEGTG